MIHHWIGLNERKCEVHTVQKLGRVERDLCGRMKYGTIEHRTDTDYLNSPKGESAEVNTEVH